MLTLTKEQINNLTESRELDALIGTHICGDIYKDRAGILWPMPFSSSYDAAFHYVVLNLRNRGWYSQTSDLTLDSGTEWWSAHFNLQAPPGTLSVHAQADSLPLAICKAALLAWLEIEA